LSPARVQFSQCGRFAGNGMTVPLGVGLVFIVATGLAAGVGAGAVLPAVLDFGSGVARGTDGPEGGFRFTSGFAAGTSFVIFPFSQIWPMFPLLISNSITLRLGFNGSA